MSVEERRALFAEISKGLNELKKLSLDQPEATAIQAELTRQIDRAVDLTITDLALDYPHIPIDVVAARVMIAFKHLEHDHDATTAAVNLGPVRHALELWRPSKLNAELIDKLASRVGWTREYVKNMLEGLEVSPETDGLRLLRELEKMKNEDIIDGDLAQLSLIAMSRQLSKGKIQLAAGFAPHTFTTFLARFLDGLPTLGIDLAMRASADATRDEIGPGVAVIERLEASGDILFAEHIESNQPSIFLAALKDFANAADAKIAIALVNYFDATGDMDPETGEILSVQGGPVDQFMAATQPATVERWVREVPQLLPTLAEEIRMSKRVIFEVMKRLEARDELQVATNDTGFLSRFRIKDIRTLTPTERKIVEFISKNYSVAAQGRYSYQGDDVPPSSGLVIGKPGGSTYMRAIELQYKTLADLTDTLQRADEQSYQSAFGATPDDLWGFDISALKIADTFCWFPDPTEAVMIAAQTLPTTVRLMRDLTPCYAGWWYFTNPIACQTNDDQDSVTAVLWSWGEAQSSGPFEKKGFTPGVTFSTYAAGAVRYDNGTTLDSVPTTRFFWPEGTSLEYLLRVIRKHWAEGSTLSIGVQREKSRDRHFAAVERIARFFAAGCLWIDQKILVQSSGHIERHTRKRLEKQVPRDRPLTDVQIIQLRRRESLPNEKPEESSFVDWKCRWVVSGHWRNQFYPSKGRHEPKFIGPYPKGPADRPLKVPSHRVYAVSR